MIDADQRLEERLGDLVDYERGRVHASVYTDPEIFALEMKRIFQGGWVYLAHGSEIPQPGDYKTTYMGQIPVILTRQRGWRHSWADQPVCTSWGDRLPT